MSTRRISFGVASAPGRRALNEDAVIAEPPVFVVADGMGGHEAGEVASAIAVRAFATLAGCPDVTAADLTACLRAAAEEVRAIETAPGLGAGTTVTGACLTEEDDQAYWIVFNLGDSRTYRLADGTLEQISVDHSEVQELIDAGQLTREHASRYQRRHVITRALGAEADMDADFWILPVGRHDRMLLCSDGLTGEISDAAITRILLEHATPQVAADVLVHAALQAGGRDNVTVLVVDTVGDDDGESETLPRAEDAAADADTLPTSIGGSR